MKLTVKFKNPLDKSQDVKKTFTLSDKKNKYYADQLLKMADGGMVIIPIDLTISIDNVDYETSILVSSPATTKGYKGLINQKPAVKINTEVTESKNEMMQPRLPWWKRIPGFDSNDIGRGIWKP